MQLKRHETWWLVQRLWGKNKHSPCFEIDLTHTHTRTGLGRIVHSLSSLSVCAAIVCVWEDLCNSASCLTLWYFSACVCECVCSQAHAHFSISKPQACSWDFVCHPSFFLWPCGAVYFFSRMTRTLLLNCTISYLAYFFIMSLNFNAVAMTERWFMMIIVLLCLILCLIIL